MTLNSLKAKMTKSISDYEEGLITSRELADFMHETINKWAHHKKTTHIQDLANSALADEMSYDDFVDQVTAILDGTE